MLDKSVLFVENENELGLTNAVSQIDKELIKKEKLKYEKGLIEIVFQRLSGSNC